MEWKPKIATEKKLVLVNVTGLADYNEEKCKYCGRYGCTDRGYSVIVGNPPVVIGESDWAARVRAHLAVIVEAHKEEFNFQYAALNESQCNRKLKKSNMQAVMDRLKSCGDDCHRNKDCALGGIWRQRSEAYHCPHRDKSNTCGINLALDGSPLTCQPDKEGHTDCGFHEEAYNRCFKRKEGGECYDLKDKFGVTDEKNDYLLMLSHRFSASPCRHCDEGTCKNEASLHNEGICVLKGLMATCEQYESVSSDHTYTEGVCTYVSSSDGKDDRKIFPSSNYAFSLSDESAFTLCMACRISHSIARATGLKCLGVRRMASGRFFNNENPMHEHAIQISYLYMTHPEDLAKFDPSLIALAEYVALIKDCEGLGCEEFETCNIRRRM